jgi:hypothetical protein
MAEHAVRIKDQGTRACVEATIPLAMYVARLISPGGCVPSK